IRQQTRIGVTELVVADEDGRGERTLATRRLPLQFLSIANGPVPHSSAPAWTPDGRAIAGCGTSGANSDIVVVDATTGATRTVHIAGGTARALLAVAWMDGDSLIVNGRLGAATMLTQLWRVASADGRASRLTNDLSDYAGVSVSVARDTLATTRVVERASIWIGDGDARNGGEVASTDDHWPRDVVWASTRLLYRTAVSGEMTLAAVDPRSGVSERIPVNVGNSRGSVAVTSDGQTVVFGGSDGLWRVAIDGRGATRVVDDSILAVYLTADDRTILFLSQRGGDQSAWLVPLA